GICVMARPVAAVPVIPRSANTPANNPKDLLLRCHWKSRGRYIYERCRAAHDDDHARPVLMPVKHAFIGLAPAVRMDGPGFPLAVLAGIQVSAGGRSERLRERCVHAV